MNVLDSIQEEEQKENAEQALKLLIEEQGVQQITDLDQLSDLWLADDDPDSLMNFVLEERIARRQLSLENLPK